MNVVKFKIIDPKGFAVYEKSANEALDFIKTYIQQNGGWFFLDKVHSNVENTTPEQLESASVITITNVIIGGSDDTLFSNT
jgi:hypothetical protein